MGLLTYAYDPVGTASIIARAIEAGQSRQQQQAQFAAQLAKEAADNRRLSLEFQRGMDFKNATLGFDREKEAEGTRRWNALNSPVDAPPPLPTSDTPASPAADMPALDIPASSPTSVDAPQSAPGVDLFNAGGPSPYVAPLIDGATQPPPSSFFKTASDLRSGLDSSPALASDPETSGAILNAIGGAQDRGWGLKMAGEYPAPSLDNSAGPMDPQIPAVNPLASPSQNLPDVSSIGTGGGAPGAADPIPSSLAPAPAGPVSHAAELAGLPVGSSAQNGPGALIGNDLPQQLRTAKQMMHDAGIPAHVANQQLADLVRQSTTQKQREQAQLALAQAKGATPADGQKKLADYTKGWTRDTDPNSPTNGAFIDPDGVKHWVDVEGNGKIKDTHVHPKAPGFDADTEAAARGLTPDGDLWKDANGMHWKAIKGAFVNAHQATGGRALQLSTPEQIWMTANAGAVQGVKTVEPILQKAGLDVSAGWKGDTTGIGAALKAGKITKAEADAANWALTQYRQTAGLKDDKPEAITKRWAADTAKLAVLSGKGANVSPVIPPAIGDPLVMQGAQSADPKVKAAADATIASKSATAPVKISSAAEFAALPKGATFIDPEGVKRIKP